MEIIGFIPARCGSKSIPQKNIKVINGKPLIYWCAEALQNSRSVTKVVIATDCEEIKKTVLDFGFSKLSVFKRDEHTATDEASTESVILNYIEKEKADNSSVFILCQPTSPLTTSDDIENSLQEFLDQKKDSLLSVVNIKRFFWGKNGASLNYDFLKRPRRQDFEGSLMENGAIYISYIRNIVKSKNRISGEIALYEMPEYTSFEIDEEYDWIIIEDLLKKYKPLTQKSGKIKLFATDVDGVLTNGNVYYNKDGESLVSFSRRDGMAFQLLRQQNIKTAIITSELSEIVQKRSQKIKADYLVQDKFGPTKLDAIKEICKMENMDLSEVAYIGDDINCKEVLQQVGWPACPNDAMDIIKNIPGISVLSLNGGNGVVREFAELVLKGYNY